MVAASFALMKQKVVLLSPSLTALAGALFAWTTARQIQLDLMVAIAAALFALAKEMVMAL